MFFGRAVGKVDRRAAEVSGLIAGHDQHVSAQLFGEGQRQRRRFFELQLELCGVGRQGQRRAIRQHACRRDAIAAIVRHHGHLQIGRGGIGIFGLELG